MTAARWLPVVMAALVAGCAAGGDSSSTPSSVVGGAPISETVGTPAPSSTQPPSQAEAIREWEAIAREHFTESATALQDVSEASSAEDEEALRSGCQRLHDTNSIGLQGDLPTPDPQLTAELQRMINDMNVATHACLRFALGRKPADADNYREFLARAVEHLYRAKAILTAARQ